MFFSFGVVLVCLVLLLGTTHFCCCLPGFQFGSDLVGSSFWGCPGVLWFGLTYVFSSSIFSPASSLPARDRQTYFFHFFSVFGKMLALQSVHNKHASSLHDHALELYTDNY